jgi:hypothetical protein
VDLIQAAGWSVVKQSLLADEESAIRALLISWADQRNGCYPHYRVQLRRAM